MKSFLLSFLMAVALVVIPATSSFAVVAPGDTAPHPTITDAIAEVKRNNDVNHTNCDITPVQRKEMDESILPVMNAPLKAGYKLAAVYYKQSGNLVYAADVKLDEKLIMIWNNQFVLLIHQVDQTAPLGTAKDMLDPKFLRPEDGGTPESAPKEEAPATPKM